MIGKQAISLKPVKKSHQTLEKLIRGLYLLREVEHESGMILIQTSMKWPVKKTLRVQNPNPGAV